MENRTENQHPPTETPSDAPRQEQSGARGFLRKNSLQLAGLLNLIGDVGFLARGLLKRTKRDSAAPDNAMLFGGILYLFGGLNLLLFGGVKPEQKLQDVEEQTASFLKQKMGALPENSELASVDKKERKPGVRDYLYKHAAQNTLYAYFLGAIGFLISGINDFRADRTQTGRMYYGITSLVIKGASILVPEKSKEPTESDSHKSKGIIDWIREKPLRIFGYGSLLTESMMALETYQKYRKPGADTKDWKWAAVSTGSYIFSDLLAAISNKDKSNAAGKLSADEQRKVEAMAAEAIAAQPGAKRGTLVEEVSGFLAKRPEIGGSRESIRKALVTQVEHKGTTQVKSAEAEVVAH